MKFKCPRGMRDFYPPQMAIRNWIVDRWRRVSLRHAFEEYDGPIFESLDLYRVKSGDAIVSELFHFTDRGDREFAIRPEMTPTLARMVAEQAQSLRKPIKWFSIPRLCRAERPQRGRLREFFQWNVDILGEDGVLADAECVFVAIDFFREVGLTTDHLVFKINSRALLASILENARIPAERFDAVYAVLDRRDKVDDAAFEKMVAGLSLEPSQHDLLMGLAQAKGSDGLKHIHGLLQDHEQGLTHLDELEQLFASLRTMGVGEFCTFDMGVVRGLAYYTGAVFEAFGKGGLKRAIGGGGRYDRLLSDVGGPPMSGTGFATSDVVIADLLEEMNLLPTSQPAIDMFVADADPDCFDTVLSLTAKLRACGVSTAFSYKRQSLSKQFKQAAGKLAKRVAVVDAETRSDNTVQIKDMATGTQRRVTIQSLLDDPQQPLGQ